MAQPGHVHNFELEGPLPAGFPEHGLQGKVRNIYQYGGQICLIASDRVSAFDQVSPTPIPDKGRILNSISAQELQAAEAAGIHTWFKAVPNDNPRAAVGTLGRVQPVEMVFRNYMTGSMWRDYQKTGDFAGFGLPEGLTEWTHFPEPLFTPSTKSDEEDVYFHPSRVEEMTGVSADTLGRMEELCRKLFDLGTERAAEKGLVLVDTKYEVGFDGNNGQLMILDEVHTPDSSRFVYQDGFEAAIQNGEEPRGLSKENLRKKMLAKAGGDKVLAKLLMAEPLPQAFVDQTQADYEELHALFVS